MREPPRVKTDGDEDRSHADRAAVREYYRRLAPWLEDSLRERGDGRLWRREAARGPARVLEVGAGTGRVTRILAAGAGSVTALDISRELLRRAMARTGSGGRILPVVGDIRSVRFSCGFDLVAAASDPFVHLVEDADRDRAFRNVARHLARDGRFVLDALWLPPAREAAAASPGGWSGERRVATHRGALWIEERWRCDPDARRCAVRYRCEPEGEPAVEAGFRGRYWSPADLRATLERAGMRARAMWGDFARVPFDPEHSPHLVVEATRG